MTLKAAQLFKSRIEAFHSRLLFGQTKVILTVIIGLGLMISVAPDTIRKVWIDIDSF